MKRLIRLYLRDGPPKNDHVRRDSQFFRPMSLATQTPTRWNQLFDLIETRAFRNGHPKLAHFVDTPPIDVAMTLGYENHSTFRRSNRLIVNDQPF